LIVVPVKESTVETPDTDKVSPILVNPGAASPENIEKVSLLVSMVGFPAASLICAETSVVVTEEESAEAEVLPNTN